MTTRTPPRSNTETNRDTTTSENSGIVTEGDRSLIQLDSSSASQEHGHFEQHSRPQPQAPAFFHSATNVLSSLSGGAIVSTLPTEVGRTGNDVTMPNNDTTPDNGNSNRVESTLSCRLPLFWKDHPQLWFLQVESVFNANRIRAEESKYHLVVSTLDADALMEISDILESPPQENRYQNLKTQMLARFADSADRQLQKMLNECELGDMKPSQLLRRMRALAGDKASEDVLRIKWLALLPTNVQNVLKIFKTNALEELVIAADQLMENPVLPFTQSANVSESAVQPQALAVQRETTELSEIKALLAQLITITRNVLNKVSNNDVNNGPRNSSHNNWNNNWSNNRSRSQTRSPGPTTCRFHRRYGANALRCLQPCNFSAPATRPAPEN